MIGAFLFLTARSMRNRAARRLRRLREPRYLAGLAVGLGYLYFAVLRNQLRAARHGENFLADPSFQAALPTVLSALGLVLWLVVLVAWFWPSGEPPLKFTGAEVQFFYPAPLTRRQILHYKLLRSQVGVVFGVLVAALFSGAATAAASGRWTFLVGGLLLFTTLRLHLLGVAFTKASLRAPGAKLAWRAWGPVGLMAGLSALVVAPFVVHASELAALGPAAMWPRLAELARMPPAAAGVWPFRAVVAPIFSPSAGAFGAAALPALLLLAANYWWVLQSDALLEEAAVIAEKRQAAGRRLAAPVARRAPFRLAPAGRPETALLWKNLILLGRYASPRTVLRMLLPIVILSMVSSTSRAGVAIAPIALVLAGVLTLFGPYMIRNDLRHDLPRLAALKTWPVSGASLLVGEIAAPAAVLSLLVWTSMAVTLAFSGSLGIGRASIVDRLSLAAAAAILAPMLIGAQLLIQNSAVILFPGWIPTGGARPRGIEAMGQQMLMLAATLLALLVGVLPAAALAAVLGLVLYQVMGLPAVVPAGLLFVASLLLEAALVVVALGRVLERTEPAQVEGDEN